MSELVIRPADAGDAAAMAAIFREGIEDRVATFETEPPTASRTALSSAVFSSSVVVGDSPVVPLSTRPSQPSATREAAWRRAASRSRPPVAVNGVIMAQRARPKGPAVWEVMCAVSVPGPCGST